MSLKVISVLVCLALCMSLISVFLPPSVEEATASPFETLVLNMSDVTWLSWGNWRNIDFQPGDEIIQFTRPNLIVGANPHGSINTLGRISFTVSGDLNGTVVSEYHRLVVSWDGLANSTGYAVETFTFDDGSGNTFSGFFVADVDDNTGAREEATAYVIGTSGTGEFAGQILIGTGVQSSGSPGTWTIRRYAASEISGRSCSAAAVWNTGRGMALSLSGSSVPDEFLQFTRSNISIPVDDPAYYGETGSATGSVTVGSQSGTYNQTWNNLSVPGTSPEWQGWIAGTETITLEDGTLKAVYVLDSLGLNLSGGLDQSGYVLAPMELTTGAWAGKDYYAEVDSEVLNPTGPTGTCSLTGTLYTLTPPGVPTSTGTGLATLVPDSGSMQNLTAVSESSMPSEGKPDILFPHGLFEFQIAGLMPGQSMTLTITLPSAVSATASYWKYGPTPPDPSSHWYQIPMGDNDGDNVITITLTDGGWGDDDLTADGTIIDQGGPGWPGPGGGGGGGHSAPAFPSIYISIAAVMGAGILASLLRRRLAHS